MNEDRIEGTARTVGGKVQEAAGRITGDAKTRVEGEINQAAGRAQNLYGQARDAAADAVEAIEEGAETIEDVVRDFVESRPYTTAAIALGIGLVVLEPGVLHGQYWLHAKLALVVVAIGYHHMCRSMLRSFEKLENRRRERWFRVFNEMAVLLFAAIVILVVVRPF